MCRTWAFLVLLFARWQGSWRTMEICYSFITHQALCRAHAWCHPGQCEGQLRLETISLLVARC